GAAHVGRASVRRTRSQRVPLGADDARPFTPGRAGERVNPPMSAPRFHQMLVSPRIGGGEKLALEIHRYLEPRSPRARRLLTPARGDTERLARAQQLDFRSYRLDWLERKDRLFHLLGNGSVAAALLGAQGLLHIHSPYVFGALRPFRKTTRLKIAVHLHL